MSYHAWSWESRSSSRLAAFSSSTCCFWRQQISWKSHRFRVYITLESRTFSYIQFVEKLALSGYSGCVWHTSRSWEKAATVYVRTFDNRWLFLRKSRTKIKEKFTSQPSGRIVGHVDCIQSLALTKKQLKMHLFREVAKFSKLRTAGFLCFSSAGPYSSLLFTQHGVLQVCSPSSEGSNHLWVPSIPRGKSERGRKLPFSSLVRST